MKAKNDYERLLNYIGTGEENAINREYLSHILNLPEREVGRCIQTARRDGILICSNESGYFFPKDKNELSAFYKRYHGAAISILCTLKTTRRELKKIGIDPKELEGG